LRHQLEPPGVPAGAVILADRFTVGLAPATVTTDVEEFETLLRVATLARSPHERRQLLTEAVEHYRGELLPGYYEDSIEPEQRRLAEAALGALGELTATLTQHGDLKGALGWARRAVAADPLREEIQRQLMELYAAAGQPEAALRQFLEFEQLLKDETGTVPA